MILSEIKQYLTGRKQATLEEICYSVKADKPVVLHALHLLVQKGSVAEEKHSPPCRSCSGGCTACSHEESVLYRISGKNNG